MNAATKYYEVICPECKGYGRDGRLICWKCGGVGKVVIPDVPLLKQPINLRGPILLCFAIVIAGLLLGKALGAF